MCLQALGQEVALSSTLLSKEGVGTFSLERFSPNFFSLSFFFPILLNVFDLAEGCRSHGTDSICKFCIWCVYWQGTFIPFVNSAYGVCGGGGSYWCLSENDWGRKDSTLLGEKEGKKGGREEGRKEKGKGREKGGKEEKKEGKKFTFLVSHSRARSSLFCGC